MRTRWIGLAVAAAALAVACGDGRAIFNVDVFSFMQGTGGDTLHYTVPGGFSGTADNVPTQVSMLGGLGHSTVDSVTITLGADMVNNTGTGADSVFIFFAADSASTYLGTPFLKAGGTLAPATTTPVTGSATFTDSLFNQQTVWVGLRVFGQANAGPALDGRMQLTALAVRIVLQDKF